MDLALPCYYYPHPEDPKTHPYYVFDDAGDPRLQLLLLCCHVWGCAVLLRQVHRKMHHGYVGGLLLSSRRILEHAHKEGPTPPKYRHVCLGDTTGSELMLMLMMSVVVIIVSYRLSYAAACKDGQRCLEWGHKEPGCCTVVGLN